MNTQQPAYRGATETFVGTAMKDKAGREIGWIAGLNSNGVDYAAWVQSARKTKPGEFEAFGVPQRSKHFGSQAAATAWAFSEAKARVAKARAAAL